MVSKVSFLCVCTALVLAVAWPVEVSADDLYSTDFDGMDVGTINGQDGWVVGDGNGTSTDGMVVDDGTGNKVLQVRAGEGYADPSGRLYSAVSTRRYQVITMWFMALDGGGPHWWMDHWHVDGVDAIFWWSNEVWTNAVPGSPSRWFEQGEWHQVGIEVDQDTGMLNAIMFDGWWFPEDDSQGAGGPGPHVRFLIQGMGAEERLWIDNLSITDRDDTVLCDPLLGVNFPPSSDSQSWIDGCDVSVNGGVVPPQDCPVITRIEWDWGDGTVQDHWFPATHTYASPGDYTVMVTAYNAAGNSSTVAGTLVDVCGGELEVMIDIKPGNDDNTIHADAYGVVAVAILTTSLADGDPLDFDALDVDETTLAFGPAGAAIRHIDDHEKDADLDGDLDLLVHIYATETGLTCDSTTATLTGMTYGGQAITGTDIVTMMNCLCDE